MIGRKADIGPDQEALFRELAGPALARSILGESVDQDQAEPKTGAAARERQRQAGKQYGIGSAKFAEPIEDTGLTRDKVGAAAFFDQRNAVYLAAKAEGERRRLRRVFASFWEVQRGR